MLLLLSLFITFLLIIASGFCSAAETALFSLSATKLKTFSTEEDSSKKKLIANLLEKPRDLLVTVFILNTVVNIVLQNVISGMIGSHGEFALKVGLPLLVTLIFGEIIPKYIGMQHNQTIAITVAPLVSFLQTILSPIRSLVISITSPLSRVLFFYLKREQQISKNELQHVLETSEKHGVLSSEEAELVWGYLNFQELSAKELVIPREDIRFYSLEDPISELFQLHTTHPHDDLLICEKELDQPKGILRAIDLFSYGLALEKKELMLSILRPIYFIPENTSIRNVMRGLIDRNEQLALSVDEYGQVTGLLLKRNLIEIITDEIDQGKEASKDSKNIISKFNDKEIIASGKMELSEFNDFFKVEFESASDMVTIGGWLIEEVGEIPQAGTSIERYNFLFQVLDAQPNRIQRLYIRKLAS